MPSPSSPFPEDAWNDQSCEELMNEAIRLEMMHQGLPEHEADAVRARFESLALTCSFLRKPDFTAFTRSFRGMCADEKLHPLALEAFLRAAWKASDEDAKGLRLIPGKAEIQARAREMRRAMILDTEQSWAYEGLNVQFRSDLEEGEDPALLAISYGQPAHLNLDEIREGMREYIESGGLETWFAEATADFEKQQAKLSHS